jgi:hypothetical protein
MKIPLADLSASLAAWPSGLFLVVVPFDGNKNSWCIAEAVLI